MTRKYFWSHNARQNIWNKLNKSTKIGQDQETFRTAFASFLISYQSFIFGTRMRLGTRLHFKQNL